MDEVYTSPNVLHFDDNRPSFEDLAKDNGFHFWMCSSLMKLLGYENVSDVANLKPVQRAITTCSSLGIPIQENFCFTDGDIKLTRFACYLVAMNSDPKKQQVAAAQAYFAAIAVQFSSYVQDDEVIDRVLTRDEITQQEKSLSSTAHHAGVENYSIFQNEGYRGMYNMNLSKFRELKGVPPKRSPLDFMGATESAANLLRIRLTEEKIRDDRIHGQKGLESTASSIGHEVRELLIRTIGKTPEDLPPSPEIRKVHQGLKRTNKGFREIDSPKNNT